MARFLDPFRVRIEVVDGEPVVEPELAVALDPDEVLALEEIVVETIRSRRRYLTPSQATRLEGLRDAMATMRVFEREHRSHGLFVGYPLAEPADRLEEAALDAENRYPQGYRSGRSFEEDFSERHGLGETVDSMYEDGPGLVLQPPVFDLTRLRED